MAKRSPVGSFIIWTEDGTFLFAPIIAFVEGFIDTIYAHYNSIGIGRMNSKRCIGTYVCCLVPISIVSIFRAFIVAQPALMAILLGNMESLMLG